jgi:penicillin-binding protein activator
MKRGHAAVGLVLAAGLLMIGGQLVGCQRQARYIDSGGPDTIVVVGQINIQDWNRAADEMITSLLISDRLEAVSKQPAVLAISRVINNTSELVDTDLLTQRIRVALNQSGKVLTTTTVGVGGRAEDPLAEELRRARDEAEGVRTDARLAVDYTLAGKIIQLRSRAGNVREATYSFHLTLTDVTTGLAVWEDQRQITKQGARPAIGW